MALKAVMDSLDGIDEPIKSLYVERNGKFELSGIEGIKTQADVDRINGSLANERKETEKWKGIAQKWGDLKHDEVVAKLDRFEELEAAAAGKIDDEKINAMAEARSKSRMAPLERQVTTLTKERDEARQLADQANAQLQRYMLHGEVRKAALSGKVLDTAVEDVLMYAERIFEKTEDGTFVTKDNVGVTPGLPIETWLNDMQKSRPHWWPASAGGGGTGGRGGNGGGSNPWSPNSWSITEQGKYIREHGMDKANAAAKSVGSKVGATAPAKK